MEIKVYSGTKTPGVCKNIKFSFESDHVPLKGSFLVCTAVDDNDQQHRYFCQVLDIGYTMDMRNLRIASAQVAVTALHETREEEE